VPILVLVLSCVYGLSRHLEALGLLVSLSAEGSGWLRFSIGSVFVWLIYSAAAAWAVYLLLRERPSAARFAAVVLLAGIVVFVADLYATFYFETGLFFEDALRSVRMSWPYTLAFIAGAVASVPLLRRSVPERIVGEDIDESDRPFGALEAVVVFLAYVAGVVVAGSLGIALWGVVSVEAERVRTYRALAEALAASRPVVVMLSTITGGLVVVGLAANLGRDRLLDRSSVGLAWVPGSYRQLVVGLVLGVSIGIGAGLLLFRVGAHQVVSQSIETIATSQQIQFLPLILNAATILVLAPLVEEALFRGVLIGGFGRSWGVPVAVSVSSLLFILVHYPRIGISWAVVASLLTLSLAASLVRIHSGAIGPAVVLHMGYNLAVAFTLGAKLANH
jgi:membrane protease YdiL (CAAX protease family)